MEKLRTVRGVHDLLPDILHKHNLVINEGLKISEKYCYQQIETPIFEFAEVFTKPLGKTSDIVLTNQWQTLYFDMSDIADGVSFSHLFIFIGPGDPNVTGTFYIDNIEGPGLQNTAGLDELNPTDFSMYPNPSSDIVFFSNLNRTTTVKIYDINMRLVKSESIDSNQILIEDLNAGIYFVEVDGHVKKLIKR